MTDEKSRVFEEQARVQITDQLTNAFADDCKPEQINEAIDRAWQRFDRAPVRDFVPLLAARIAREELHRLSAEQQG
ncbi:three-helix bundle dimerization domain-containing protein [Nonomuraea sp. 3N208]|uniref:three-helix bundle dimerization domain-containing protein n=1 Tax=Nonomuraea sp. 3N208 TaxID=3457421 RepID=UPI003FD5C7E9